MRHFPFSFLLIISLFVTIRSSSQTDDNNGNSKAAKDNFSLGNYKGALEEYLLLIKNDSNNVTYNFRIGICYLNTNIDKSKAITFLLKAVSDPKVETMAWYELGRAYMLNYQFDKAIEYFNKYKEIAAGKESFYISSERMIEMCEEAKNKIKKPVNVTIENLGPEINSPFPDYNPYVPADESFLIFASKRTGNTGGLVDFDGYLTADAYITYQKYDNWLKAKNIGGALNSELVEEPAGISADGSKLFLYCDNYTAMNQVVVANRKGKTFNKPEYLGDNIYSTNKIITSAAITPNKKYLVFSSSRNEQSAGMDLFISKKLPSGDWGPAVNIGEPVNSVYDEDFPYFSSDGQTLYFCSEGQNSMGGYDIFKTTFNEKEGTWSEPENLGYPINTPDDDLSISFSLTGRRAYISSFRSGGYGDLDIYKITFNNIDPSYTIFSGSLMDKDSLNLFRITASSDTLKDKKDKKDTMDTASDPVRSKKNISVSITATDKTTQKVFGNYLPNRENGKFLIILPPGEYEITVNAEGYEKYSEVITAYDRSRNTEISKDIVLQESSSEKNK